MTDSGATKPVPLLSLDGVSKSYWSGTHRVDTLRNVSFALRAGDFAAVQGERDSGKTTLLRIASGVEMPDVGTVSYEGVPITAMSDSTRSTLWNTSLALVLDGWKWPARTALDTVMVPLLGAGMTRREARRRAYVEMQRWVIHDAADAGYHELSNVKRRRVALANALVRRPRVLLADDPTETLNIMERNHVLAHLQQVVREEGIAVLMTTTDMSGAAGTNRQLYLIGNGEICEAEQPTRAPVIPLPRTGDA
jgi:putative ABC transport system ATP-binding protein